MTKLTPEYIERSCTRKKVAVRSKVAAKRLAIDLAKKHGCQYDVYKCSHCGFHHLATRREPMTSPTPGTTEAAVRHEPGATKAASYLLPGDAINAAVATAEALAGTNYRALNYDLFVHLHESGQLAAWLGDAQAVVIGMPSGYAIHRTCERGVGAIVRRIYVRQPGEFYRAIGGSVYYLHPDRGAILQGVYGAERAQRVAARLNLLAPREVVL